MAAGISKEREQYLRRKMINKYRRQLEHNGVEVEYIRGGQLCAKGKTVDAGIEFNLKIVRMNASNGECCLFPRLSLNSHARLGDLYSGYHDGILNERFDAAITHIIAAVARYNCSIR